MNNKRYWFFVSYPRIDDPGYIKMLHSFIDEIAAGFLGCLPTGDEPYYIDKKIKPGEDWTEEIKKALRTSYTMIAICLPTYFERPYCGKEYFIFLRRMHLLERESGVKKNKIIPIMWSPFKTLQKFGFPPSHLNDTAFKIPDDLYINDKGLWTIARRAIKNPDNSFKKYAEHVTNLILNEVLNEPLPVYKEPFYYRNVRNAFNEEDFRKVEEGVCASDPESFGIQDRVIQTSNNSPSIKTPLNKSLKSASAEDRSDELPFLRVPGGNKQ